MSDDDLLAELSAALTSIDKLKESSASTSSLPPSSTSTKIDDDLDLSEFDLELPSFTSTSSASTSSSSSSSMSSSTSGVSASSSASSSSAASALASSASAAASHPAASPPLTMKDLGPSLSTFSLPSLNMSEQIVDLTPQQNELRRLLNEQLDSKRVSAPQVREICHRFVVSPLSQAPSSSNTPCVSASEEYLSKVLRGADDDGKELSGSLSFPARSPSSQSFEFSSAPSAPVLPDDLRPAIWKVLLGCQNKDESTFETWDRVLDLPNQKVVRMDCDRTRPNNDKFEADGGALRNELEVLLTFYCKSRGVTYKQGMNEIMAPFLVCFEGYPRATVLNCFYALVSKFLPSIFNDREFESLQCIMRLFNLLLLYHDPALCNFLNQYEILPELYATPWFITLFSRKVPLPVVYRLWDVYIIEDDPFLHYFVALTLLIRQREQLLQVMV